MKTLDVDDVCLWRRSATTSETSNPTAPDSASCNNEEGAVCPQTSKPLWSSCSLRHRREDSGSSDSWESSDSHDDWRERSHLSVCLTASHVEPWQRFPYLTYGYRSGGDYFSCICSLLQLHNETFNAWTMVFRCGCMTQQIHACVRGHSEPSRPTQQQARHPHACAAFMPGLYVCVHVRSSVLGHLLFFSTIGARHLRTACWADLSPFLAVWLGQSLHAPLSCAYHTFMCISPEVANFWRRLDLAFILVSCTRPRCAARARAAMHGCYLGVQARALSSRLMLLVSA